MQPHSGQRQLRPLPGNGGPVQTKTQRHLPLFSQLPRSPAHGGAPAHAPVPSSSAAAGSRQRRSRSAHQQRRAGTSAGGVRCASAPPPIVASELIVNDKTFTTPTPPQAMAVSRHLMWLSYADGGCEVRNTRTAEVVKRFSGSTSSAPETQTAGVLGVLGAGGLFGGSTGKSTVANAKMANVVIKAMLSVITRCGEPQVWLGLSNGSIEVHHGETTELIVTLRKHLGSVNALAEFGGLVYSGGNDHQVVQWRSEGCRYLRSFMGAQGHEGEILCMHAEGNALVTGAADDTVKVWDVGTGDMQLTGYFHARSGGGVTALCRVAQQMWSGDHSGQLVRWSLRTGEAADISTPHKARINALKRAGLRVYSGSADGSIGVFCAETGRLLKRIEDQARGWVTCVACPAQLSRFVVWSADAAGRVGCWYQDEYVFMSRDHEQLNEETWYRSGSTPYGEFRRSIAQRNAQLKEQLRLAEQRDARAMAILRRCSTALGGGAAADVEAQYAKLQDQLRMVEDRRSRLEQDLQQRKEEAAQADRDLAATLALLQSTQSDLNTLSFGYGDRLFATLPPIPSAAATTTTAAVGGEGTGVGVAPGVTLSGLPGAALPLSTAATTTAAASAGPSITPLGVVTASLPTDPMQPPPPLSQPEAGTTATTTVVPAPINVTVAPLAPLGVPAPVTTFGTNATPSSTFPLPTVTSVPAFGVPTITTTTATTDPLSNPYTNPPIPTAVAGVGLTTASPYGLAAATTATGIPGASIGVGGLLGQPPTTLPPDTAAPVAAVGVAAAVAQPQLSHEQQVLALLASLEDKDGKGKKASGKGAADEDGVDGVKWVNPNVGNYIQRRYYGAFPSLRTPAIEKREKKKARMPKVKVVPLPKSRSASATKGAAASGGKEAEPQPQP